MARHFIHGVSATVRQIEAETGMDLLSIRARLLLRAIGEATEITGAPRVSDLARTGCLGTAPTIYACLGELEGGKWIERRPDPTDLRAATLHLTARARRAFERMSRRIVQLAARHSIHSPREAPDGGDQEPREGDHEDAAREIAERHGRDTAPE